MRGLPGDTESGKNLIMPNNWVNQRAGSSVALIAESSVPPLVTLGVMCRSRIVRLDERR
jgi:hypothetical protein